VDRRRPPGYTLPLPGAPPGEEATLDLTDLIQPERLTRLEQVLAQRTRRVSLVLEELYDPHNAAACLRSAEAFGVQDVHVIAARHAFDPSPRVVQGADKWLTLRRHAGTAECVTALRAAGYRIWVSDLAPGARRIDAIDFGEPVALAFGNEHEGVSRTLADLADGTFVVPMRGFTQSFNVSVAVALSLYHAVSRRAALAGPAGDLPPEEHAALRQEWVRKAVKSGDRVVRALERSGAARGAPEEE
jgi:tRNA (guanosine-2'-O-)-methyltransferase